MKDQSIQKAGGLRGQLCDKCIRRRWFVVFWGLRLCAPCYARQFARRHPPTKRVNKRPVTKTLQ